MSQRRLGKILLEIRRIGCTLIQPHGEGVMSGYLLSCMLLVATLIVPAAWAQVNVLTQHNNNSRTGANLNETVLNTSNVRPGQFGKLFSRSVDGQIYSQPLYVSNLAMAGAGIHNAVFVTTQHNSVYAFDADDPDQSAPLWKVNLGPSVVMPNNEFGNRYGPYHDLFPELGIASTPAIDLKTNTLYVVAFTKELGVYHQRLHALDLGSGEEKLGGPVEIGGSVPGTGDGSVGGRVSFEARQHLQRPALLLSNGVLYVAFASHADTDPYHGWVFAYDAGTLKQLDLFCTTPNGGEGGIWQSNRGPVADAEGNVYVMIGNNRMVRPDLVLPNYGESFVKLRLGKNGFSVVDYFTPCNQCCLDRDDADLGSTGPVLLADLNWLLGVGKQGLAYVLDQNNLGQYRGGQTPTCSNMECNSCVDDQIVQRFRATSGGNYSSPIYWNGPDGPTFYVWGNSDRLKEYRMNEGLFRTSPASQSAVSGPWGGGGVSLSADGKTPGTGIVWGSFPLAGSNPITQMGEFHAFDASNLANDLWHSNMNNAFDGIGTLAKYNVPTIANGKVYMPSASGQLHVYGLLGDNPPPLVRIIAPTSRSAIAGPADIALMARALTRDGSPGTLVDFYADDTLVGTAVSEPYIVVWQKAPLGAHTLVAVATGPNGATARSSTVEINVAEQAPQNGRTISIKLLHVVSTPMGPGEIAGVVARSNWNNAISEDSGHARKEGWLNTLIDDSGTPTGARMSWTATSTFALIIPDTPGDFRMMRGYLETSNTTSTNVTVYDLPESFTASGYDVYVYFDGDNGAEARSANYRIGSTLVSGVDAAGANFSGDFIEAMGGGEGNYVVIPGLTEDRFNLEAMPPFSGSTTRRAPVNSIQIVAHSAK
jgi:hypothetical protein